MPKTGLRVHQLISKSIKSFKILTTFFLIHQSILMY